MKLAKSLLILPVFAALSISSCVNTVPSGNLYSTYGSHGAYDPNSFGGHGGGYGGGYATWPNCPDQYNGNYNDYYLCDRVHHVESYTRRGNAAPVRSTPVAYTK